MEMILPIYGIDVELFKKGFMNMKIKVKQLSDGQTANAYRYKMK